METQEQALGDARKKAAKIQPGQSQDRLHSGSLKPGMDRQLSKHLLLTHVLLWAHEGVPVLTLVESIATHWGKHTLSQQAVSWALSPTTFVFFKCTGISCKLPFFWWPSAHLRCDFLWA